jgi:hypothetical protein
MRRATILAVDAAAAFTGESLRGRNRPVQPRLSFTAAVDGYDRSRLEMRHRTSAVPTISTPMASGVS